MSINKSKISLQQTLNPMTSCYYTWHDYHLNQLLIMLEVSTLLYLYLLNIDFCLIYFSGNGKKYISSLKTQYQLIRYYNVKIRFVILMSLVNIVTCTKAYALTIFWVQTYLISWFIYSYISLDWSKIWKVSL